MYEWVIQPRVWLNARSSTVLADLTLMYFQIAVNVIGKFLCPEEVKDTTGKKENIVTDITPLADKQLSPATDKPYFYSPIRSEKYKLRNPEANRNKWKIFGVVLDRIFFLVYLLVLLFAYIFIFPKPHMILHLL